MNSSGSSASTPPSRRWSSLLASRVLVGLRPCGLLALGLAVVLSEEAAATWSIVAVDPATQEVGSAVASCTVGVDMVSGVVPGKGVIVAQGTTNLSALKHGIRLIAGGAGPGEAIAEIANEDFDPERFWGALLPWSASWHERQYGVAVLDANPAVANFTGDETVPWSGAMAGSSVSVQGNMLFGAEVVEAAYRAFRESEGLAECRLPLAERLLRALEAGAARGGDKRCAPERAALTASLTVARPADPPDEPSLFLAAPRAFGMSGAIRNMLFPYRPSEETPPPVAQLRKMYESWLPDHPSWTLPCLQSATDPHQTPRQAAPSSRPGLADERGLGPEGLGVAR